MRFLFLAVFVFLFLRIGFGADRSSPVVVELFTSEGCSSCPPADALLGDLERQPLSGVEVIPLGLHVDYWNHDGWQDRFSSPLMSERQQRYAEKFGLDSVYTPQIVVDGKAEFVGSDGQRIRDAIHRESAAARPVTVELVLKSPELLSIHVDGKAEQGAEIMLAITESKLTTSVRAGENNGHTLNHAAVVRELRTLGSLKAEGYTGSVPLALGRDWRRENVRAVVFVQETGSRRIVGAQSIALK